MSDLRKRSTASPQVNLILAVEHSTTTPLPTTLHVGPVSQAVPVPSTENGHIGHPTSSPPGLFAPRTSGSHVHNAIDLPIGGCPYRQTALLCLMLCSFQGQGVPSSGRGDVGAGDAATVTVNPLSLVGVQC